MRSTNARPLSSIFFRAQSPSLYARLCLITGNRAEAEELSQDAFLKVWERWDRVADLEEPVAYLYRTAMNLFRTRYRRALLALRKAVSASAAGRVRRGGGSFAGLASARGARAAPARGPRADPADRLQFGGGRLDAWYPSRNRSHARLARTCGDEARPGGRRCPILAHRSNARADVSWSPMERGSGLRRRDRKRRTQRPGRCIGMALFVAAVGIVTNALPLGRTRTPAIAEEPCRRRAPSAQSRRPTTCST